MTDTRQERYPLTEHARSLLSVWAELAAELNLTHGEDRTRTGLNGLGDPAGPRKWRDNGPVAHKAFLAYFLPVDGKLINHHLEAEFAGNQVTVIGGNHVGRRVETTRRDHTRETFRHDLRQAARLVGLLP